MNDNNIRAELIPLHTTVGSANENDTGWMWWEDDWRLTTIIHDGINDTLYAAFLLGENRLEYDVDEIAGLPWIPISRPPYEGDEKPCTHSITIMDQRATCTFSWSMDKTDGKNSLQKIVAYVNAMLNESDDPLRVD